MAPDIVQPLSAAASGLTEVLPKVTRAMRSDGFLTLSGMQMECIASMLSFVVEALSLVQSAKGRQLSSAVFFSILPLTCVGH